MDCGGGFCCEGGEDDCYEEVGEDCEVPEESPEGGGDRPLKLIRCGELDEEASPGDESKERCCCASCGVQQRSLSL